MSLTINDTGEQLSISERIDLQFSSQQSDKIWTNYCSELPSAENEDAPISGTESALDILEVTFKQEEDPQQSEVENATNPKTDFENFFCQTKVKIRAKRQCEYCLKFWSINGKIFKKHSTSQLCPECGVLIACAGLAETHKSFSNCGMQMLSGETEKNVHERVACKLCHQFYKSEKCHFGLLQYKSCKNCRQKFDCRGLCRKHEAQCCKFLCCKTCGQNSRDKKSLLIHIKQRCCKRCSQISRCYNQFLQHDCSGTRICSEDRNIEEINHSVSSITRTKCKYCQQLYYSDKAHFARIRTSCRNCKQNFECRGLCIEHERQCCEFLKCKICRQNFTTKTGRKIHTKERRCKYCPHVSQCNSLFKKHKCSEKGGEKAEEVIVVGDDEQIQEIEPPLSKMQCRFCQLVCKSIENFECHTRPIDCPRCGFAQPCNTLLAHHLDVCRFERKDDSHQRMSNFN